jgi:spore germination cell wall hydrolase CwlJ-like protein
MIVDISLLCVAMAVYFEARSEDIYSQTQVAFVIKNRIDHSAWPDNACDVVKQKHQFSFYWDGKPEHIKDLVAWETAKYAAQRALDVPFENLGATYYHSTAIKAPAWAKKMTRLGQMGKHIFYADSRDINK